MGQLIDDIKTALQSEKFLAYPPDTQKKIREEYSLLLEQDPDFAVRMTPVDRERIRNEVLTGRPPKNILETLGLYPQQLSASAKEVGGIFARRTGEISTAAGEHLGKSGEALKRGDIVGALGELGLNLLSSGSLASMPVAASYESAYRGVGLKPEQSKLMADISEMITGLALSAGQSTGKIPRLTQLPQVRQALGMLPEGHPNVPAVIQRGLPDTEDVTNVIPESISRPFQDRLRYGTSPIESEMGHTAEEIIKRFINPQEPTRFRTILQKATDIMKETGQRIDERLFTVQLRDTIVSHPERFKEFMANGESAEDIANLMAGSTAGGARSLALVGVAKRMFNDAVGQSATARKIAENIRDENRLSRVPSVFGLAYDYLHRASDIWRGMLVTQLATAVRNAEVQGVRVGLDSMVNITESAIQKATGKAPNPASIGLGRAFDESLEMIRLLVGNGKSKTLEKILDSFPGMKDQLFTMYAGDVARMGEAAPGAVGKALHGAENVVEFANTLNRGQEFFWRRAHFPLAMAKLLRDRGLIKSLDDIARVDFRDVPRELVEKAVEDSLEVTFAKSPNSALGRKFVELFSLPGLAQIIPFPRFMAAGMRFLTEFSPVGFLKLLSPREQYLIANGDYKTIAKATIGSGLLGAALLMRLSPMAGDKFYELRMPDGTIVDTRPIAPLSSYLAFAEAMLVANDTMAQKGVPGFAALPGTKRRMDMTDLLNAVGSTSFRFGSGLFMLDQVNSYVRDLRSIGAPEKLGTVGKEVAGGLVSGLVTPAQTFKDLLSDPRFINLAGDVFGSLGRPINKEAALKESAEEAKVRDVRESPFSAQILQRIPGLSQLLPERERPVGKEEHIRESGFHRQTTGVTKRTRTVAEAEMERLGILDRQLLPPTGIPALDRRIAQELRPMVEKVIPFLVTSTNYPNLPPNAQSTIILDMVEQLRRPLLKAAKAQFPAAQIELDIRRERAPTEQLLRELLQRGGVQQPLIAR